MECDIEIFFNNRWRQAAVFELKSTEELRRGIKGAGIFEYDMDYAMNHLNSRSIEAVSCLYPVNFEIHSTSFWPSFLLDILPSGANRRYFLNELGIRNNPEADWPLLLAGAGNPPGNIRIAQAVSRQIKDENPSHDGFNYDEVVNRAEYFIEYAKEHGAPVAGSSGAQGDAPKFLLTQDRNGKFHADGALPDTHAKKHWLVKFPRGKSQVDRDILRNECAYHLVAEKVGLHTIHSLRFDNDVLFVPRFDRVPGQSGVIRYGLESLSSLSGISEFGFSMPLEKLCTVIAKYSTDPEKDIIEFIYRDILNVAMGNTDNHGRNTAFLKYPDGRTRLSPLYDFAPMFLDDQGIPRTCRWTGIETGGIPEWGKVAELLDRLNIAPEQIRTLFAEFSKTIIKLPEIMEQCGVDTWLVEQLVSKINNVRISLEAATPCNLNTGNI